MKDKIVGKLVLLIFLACRLCATTVNLNVTDMDGIALATAVVGEPFMLEVNVTDSDSTLAPRIKGLKEFVVHNAGIQIRSINNDSSVKHLFKVRSDKAGDYIIGPATISIDGKKISSKELSLSRLQRHFQKQSLIM